MYVYVYGKYIYIYIYIHIPGWYTPRSSYTGIHDPPSYRTTGDIRRSIHPEDTCCPLLNSPAACVLMMEIRMKFGLSNSRFESLPRGSNIGVLVAVKLKGFGNE